MPNQELMKVIETLPEGTSVYDLNHAYISMVLKKHKGNRTRAAKEARLSINGIKKCIIRAEYCGYYIEPIVRGRPKNDKKREGINKCTSQDPL